MVWLVLGCIGKDMGAFGEPPLKEAKTKEIEILYTAVTACEDPIEVSFVEQSSILNANSRIDTDGYHDDGPQMAVLDIDQDGYWDVLTCFPWEPLFSYELRADGSVFSDWVSDYCGPMAVTDINNDGYMDVLMASETYVGEKVIGLLPFMNKEGAFLEETTVQPFDGAHARNIRLGDFNKDGSNDALISRSGEGIASQDFIAWGKADGSFDYDRSALAAEHAQRRAFGAAVYDFDDNGWEDIVVANDMGMEYGGNVLWWNTGGQFEIADDSCGCMPVQSAMGMDLGDINKDGFVDIASSDIVQTILLQGVDGLNWVDVGQSVQINLMEDHEMGWGLRFVDIQNDGSQDIFLAQGDQTYEGLVPEYEGPMTVSVFGLVDNKFEEQAPEFGMTDEGSFRSVVPMHWNTDGVLDYWVSDVVSPPLLYVSQGCSENNWLYLEAPEGTQLSYMENGLLQRHRVHSSSSYGASIQPQIHLGFGARSTLENAQILIPGESEWRLLESPLSLPNRIHIRQDYER